MSCRRVFVHLVVAAAVVAGAACSGADDADSGTFTPGPATVSDAGEGARTVRVWDWDGASSATVTLATAVTQTIAVGDGPESVAPLPTSVTTLTIAARPAAPGGEDGGEGDGGEGAGGEAGAQRTELVVTVADVTATTEGIEVADPELAAALADQQDAMSALVGASAVVHVTPSGAVTSYAPAAPSTVELAVMTLLERTITELERLLVDWPDEAIGVGARWETSSVRTSQGIDWDVTVSWHLRAVERDRSTVEFEVREVAARQEVPTAEGREIEGVIEGEGVVVVDLADAAILSGESTTELDATVFDGDAIVATTSNRTGTIATS